jgi:hypothetical protein
VTAIKSFLPIDVWVNPISAGGDMPLVVVVVISGSFEISRENMHYVLGCQSKKLTVQNSPKIAGFGRERPPKYETVSDDILYKAESRPFPASHCG